MLHKKRILIPSPKPMALRLARGIAERNGIPVPFPVIAILQPDDQSGLDDSLNRLSEFDWVLFTSSNGVLSFFRRVHELGISGGSVSSVRFGAVGPQTAGTITRFGQRVRFVPSCYTGRHMAQQIYMRAGQRFLLPASDIAGDALARGLSGRGGLVERVTAYRTIVQPVPPGRSIELERGVDAVLFTSASTVDALLHVVPDGRAIVKAIAVGSIGPTTSAALGTSDITVDFEAATSTADGLCIALVDHFGSTVTHSAFAAKSMARV